jgi:adenylyltransferase/sulfurtransferase
MSKITLTRPEVLRYSRHLMIPEVGLAGQEKLKNASVLIVGTGGLGSPVALYLAAAGVGRIGLVDYDVVDETNLQRQVIHTSERIGTPKVESARKQMLDLNPYIRVEIFNDILNSQNAKALSRDFDILIDGTDNFPTRYLLNDLAVMSGKPYIYGSIFRFEGQVSVFDARHGPCYRCLFPSPPPPGLVPSCAEGGVFGVLPGTIGTLQATEAIKLILGAGEPLIGKLLIYEALDSTFQKIILRKNPSCQVCGAQPQIKELIDYEAFCGSQARSRQGAPSSNWDIEPLDLAERIKKGEKIMLLDVRDPVEQQVSAIPGAVNIPLGQLAVRFQELDPALETVVYCRSGVRSLQAIQVLAGHGFHHLHSLKGGINAWVRQVNPELYEY